MNDTILVLEGIDAQRFYNNASVTANNQVTEFALSLWQQPL